MPANQCRPRCSKATAGWRLSSRPSRLKEVWHSDLRSYIAPDFAADRVLPGTSFKSSDRYIDANVQYAIAAARLVSLASADPDACSPGHAPDQELSCSFSSRA